jgi:peptidoglycan/xylan/chitin deacetylase (PgdA/CDA1 family)
MRFTRDDRVVPVLMFHSVGLEDYPWVWRSLSESVDSLERKLTLLKQRGFRSISWDALYGYMEGSRSLPRNSILLTFDDGYLDNWVLAYPILKRLGMKATIFFTPEFVDPGTACRPTLDDVAAGRCARGDLQVAGFLNWPELRAMEASELIDVQSHALTHTWHFSGPEILDLHAPHDCSPYPWLMWNARPDRKAFYLTENQESFVPWGHPIFRHEKALIATRFFPDADAVRALTDYVAAQGGQAFCEAPRWRESVAQHLRTLGIQHGFPGHYETDAERELRIRHELSRSKQLLEQHLRKQVDFICWPGGGNDETVRRIALEVGYKAWTLGSREFLAKRNLPNTDPRSIRRMTGGSEVRIRGNRVGQPGARFHLFRVYAHQHSLWHRSLLYAWKLALVTRSAA